MIPDASLTFLQNMDLFWLIAAAAGGFFGAALGANIAFGFTGILILVSFGIAFATGSDIGFSYLSFGPVFGPHISFAGGVAAAAYAGVTRGLMPDTGAGKDLNRGLAGLGRPDVLLVGAIFGVGGYVVNNLFALIPWFGSSTDTVALTVFTSGCVARLIFGKKAVFAWTSQLNDNHRWLVWQETPKQVTTLGLLAGLFGAGAALKIAEVGATMSAETSAIITANAKTLPFAISAATVILLAFGSTQPVTHHMTIMGGMGAVVFMPIVNNGILALVIGMVFGLISAWMAELMQRAFNAKGDTHIDPPAMAIWPTTLLISICAQLVG